MSFLVTARIFFHFFFPPTCKRCLGFFLRLFGLCWTDIWQIVLGIAGLFRASFGTSMTKIERKRRTHFCSFAHVLKKISNEKKNRSFFKRKKHFSPGIFQSKALLVFSLFAPFPLYSVFPFAFFACLLLLPPRIIRHRLRLRRSVTVRRDRRRQALATFSPPFLQK